MDVREEPLPGIGQPPLTMQGGHRVLLSLCLPRDRLSVPVVRHLTKDALGELGVRPEVSEDIELAVTEACANVLEHSGPGDAYDVTITIGGGICEIRVIDTGHGFDQASLGASMADVGAETGRGVALMRALMDEVRLRSVPERGTIVHLVKQLEFVEQAPARRLLVDSEGSG